MKKGFTLIELLAVIIVLAIIALVATPIVLDVIKDSRDSAAKDSAYGVLHSANYYYAEEYMKNDGVFTEYECSFNNKQGCDLLSISGDKPTSGSLLIDKDGKVNGKIQFNDYEFYICNSKVLENESSECNFIEYENIYAINDNGVITGFKTEDNVSLLDFIIPTVYASNLTKEAEEYIQDGKITIPEYVRNKEVTGIGDNAFSGYEITEVTILSSNKLTIGTNAFPSTLTKLRVNSCLKDNYDLGVETEGIGTCETENTTPIVTYKCKRATELHTEICSQSNSSSNCRDAGYAANSTITYGSLGTRGELTSGDAFDCDVNGDGIYDAKTERFYYISDLYNTTSNTWDNNYAALIYYNNTYQGVANNSSSGLVSYDLSNENWHGPVTAIKNLPTTEQWGNVSLLNVSRAILNQINTTSTNGGPLPQAFSYKGYAARLLTAQELSKACGITVGTSNVGDLDKCNYLFENTKYSSSSMGTMGSWLETSHYNGADYAYHIVSTRRWTTMVNVSDDKRNGVRPVIEVLKTDIEI